MLSFVWRCYNRGVNWSPQLARLFAAVWKPALLAIACETLPGCVILPTVPVNAPGYGHTYRIVDENGQPIRSGLLVLESAYEMAAFMVNCYPIEDGKAVVPLKIGTRYGHGFWSAAGLPVVGYFGMLHNPKWTTWSVLAPRYVPAPTVPPEEEFMNGLRAMPKIIRLKRADRDAEVSYLRHRNYRGHNDAKSTKSDKSAVEIAQCYADRRLKELDATPATQKAD